ncbi:N-acetyltransferase 8-like [Bacillus rossius redtenbacheri]|uniref:N-acetyltransferase 8-like n=1 Tax=Bacillus rossius redtenbacheri TaxID=93214 RepID=UPI002FDDE9AC
MAPAVRPWRPGDESACRALLSEAAMATVHTAFLSSLTRELTFQLVVLTAALLFIFVGVPLARCALAAPLVGAALYAGVWLSHAQQAARASQGLHTAPRRGGCWVAELPGPLLGRPRVVGVIAVTQSLRAEDRAWVPRLAVARAYRRRGVASALLDRALAFCRDQGYVAADLVISEYHDAARRLFHEKGFSLRQVYHRPVLGSLVTVCLYQLCFEIRAGRLSADP